MPWAGSMTRPLVMRMELILDDSIIACHLCKISSSRLRRLPTEQIQHRHANGQAVGDLLENRGVRTVGDLGGDFDAAVDRSGSQEKDVGLGQLEPIAVHAKKVGILADRREQAVALAFELNAKHVDHIAPRQDIVKAKRHFHSQACDALWHQGRRAADDDLCAQLQQTVDVAASHPAMSDIANQTYSQSFQTTLDPSNREDVEQALGRMLVGAVAGVDDPDIDMLG